MLLFLLLFAPACTAALLYDKFSPGKRSTAHLTLSVAVFALIINLLMCIMFVFQGYEIIFLDENTANARFSLSFLLLGLVFACLTAGTAIGVSRLRYLKKEHRENKKARQEK